jgi:hypothetical protein
MGVTPYPGISSSKIRDILKSSEQFVEMSTTLQFHFFFLNNRFEFVIKNEK